jgi:hypothetical protein
MYCRLPAEQDERQDDAAVLGLLVVAPQQIGDGPDKAGVVGGRGVAGRARVVRDLGAVRGGAALGQVVPRSAWRCSPTVARRGKAEDVTPLPVICPGSARMRRGVRGLVL